MDHSSHDMNMDHSSMDHSSHNMDDMSMSEGGGGMDHMMMGAMGTFHWGTTGDGLWIDTWVPQTNGAYAGALIGIFFMTVLSRGIYILEIYFLSQGNIQKDRIPIDKSSEKMRNIKYDVEAPSRFSRLPTVPSFSWKNDTIRSTISAFSTFISYLLMMAVMTGNGGYFFILVAGVFVGEIIFGRYKHLAGVHSEHDH